MINNNIAYIIIIIYYNSILYFDIRIKSAVVRRLQYIIIIY